MRSRTPPPIGWAAPAMPWTRSPRPAPSGDRSSSANRKTYYGVLAALEADSVQPGQDVIPRLSAMAGAVPVLPGDDGSRAFAEKLAEWPRGPPHPPNPPARQFSATAPANGVCRTWSPTTQTSSAPNCCWNRVARAEGLKLLETGLLGVIATIRRRYFPSSCVSTPWGPTA